MDIAKICAVAVCTTLLCLLLRGKDSSAAMLVAIGGGVCITLYMLPAAASVFSGMSDILAAGGIDSSVCTNLVKVTGIAYFTEICSGLCRDSGESALAAKLDIAGRVAILTLTVPAVKNLIDTICNALTLI